MNDSADQMFTMAVSIHELFDSYVRAGFTADQAMYLVDKQVEAASRPHHD